MNQPVKSICVILPVFAAIDRSTAQGMMDLGFNPGTGSDDTEHCLGIQPNGKIVAGGYFLTMDLVSRRGVARLLPNGKLDASFDPGTNVDQGVQTLALQKDAKVLLGGYFNKFNGPPDVELARLLPAHCSRRKLAKALVWCHYMNWHSHAQLGSQSVPGNEQARRRCVDKDGESAARWTWAKGFPGAGNEAKRDKWMAHPTVTSWSASSVRLRQP